MIESLYPDEELIEVYPEGIARQCKHCGTWSHYKRPDRRCKCFTVSCDSCHREFEIVIGMKHGRQ